MMFSTSDWAEVVRLYEAALREARLNFDFAVRSRRAAGWSEHITRADYVALLRAMVK